MKTIRVSDEVWGEIVKRGKFGETPDDVLKRVFKIEIVEGAPGTFRKRIATKVMRAKVKSSKLLVAFDSGPSKDWDLPSRENKMAIREIRDEALSFAMQNGATEGQQKALVKALTSANYYLIK